MKIRASSMPLAVLCPGSLKQPAGYFLATENYASRLGTAVHDWLSDRLEKEDKQFEYYATKHSVKVVEVEKLSLKAFRLYGEVAEFFPTPRVEVPHELVMTEMTLTGHMDVLDYNPVHRMAVVLDYKTGFLDGDHEEQIKTYGLLALDLYPEAEKVFTIILNVRDYTRDQQVYTREALNDWYKNRVVERIAPALRPMWIIDNTDESLMQRLAEAVGNEDAIVRIKANVPSFETIQVIKYNPGSHCRFCNFRSQCPAYEGEITKAADVIKGGDRLVPAPDLYKNVLHIEKLCKDARFWLHDHVLAAGGSIPLDDKYDLKLSSTVEQEVVFGPALAVLRQHLTPEDIAEISSIGITALKEKIMANHGHGQKGKAFAGMMQQLQDAGALNQKTKTQLVKRKKDDEPGAPIDDPGS